MAVLVGGHAFDVDRARLMFSLWLTIATGAALLAVESGMRPGWLRQGRGLMTVAKLGLICVVPFAWNVRVPLLIAALVLASVGSHMPARYRYGLVLDRSGKVVPDIDGPGVGSLPGRDQD